MHLRLAVLGASLALGLAAPVPVVTVSGASPFADCFATGDAFVNAEVEPSIALDPLDARRLVVVYQEDRYADGAARGIVAARSADGGRTWQRTPLPIGYCAGLSSPFRVTDPWVSFGPDGTAYALGSNVAVVSGDGGKSWHHATVLAEPTDTTLLDKGSLTADPVQPGVAYAVWARYFLRDSGAPVQSDAMLAKTTNGGKDWSDPIVIARHGPDSGPTSSVILPDPRRHRLYHFGFWLEGEVPRADRSSFLFDQVSTDGGATWSPTRTIAHVGTVGEKATDPQSGRVIRAGFAVPSFSVDRSTGTLYAVWQENRFAGARYDQIAFSRSVDGRSWSRPMLVSPLGRQAIVPVVAAARGAVGVTYFELPAGRTTSRAPVQYWLAGSTDGGRHWSRRRVGPPFSLATAPLIQAGEEQLVPPGLFLGDYMGMAADATGFRLAFVTANRSTTNRTDVRFARVKR